MKADRKRLKGEKTDLVSQMQQLYATLESREEQLRDFIRNYEQHRKVSRRPALSCPALPSPPNTPAPTPPAGWPPSQGLPLESPNTDRKAFDVSS